MVVNANHIRVNPNTREVRFDVEACMATTTLQEMLKSFETHDEFSTHAKVIDLLNDPSTNLLAQKRLRAS